MVTVDLKRSPVQTSEVLNHIPENRLAHVPFLWVMCAETMTECTFSSVTVAFLGSTWPCCSQYIGASGTNSHLVCKLRTEIHFPTVVRAWEV